MRSAHLGFALIVVLGSPACTEDSTSGEPDPVTPDGGPPVGLEAGPHPDAGAPPDVATPVDHGAVDCPGGVRPPIADCFRGDAFAECGGTGEYRLGCEPHGGCLWFVGGCVAAEY